MRRMSLVVTAMKPRPGPPKFMALPSAWPSPTTMSAPSLPGASSSPSETGSATTTKSAPAACASSATAGRSSSAPKKLGCCTTTAAVSSPTAAAQGVQVGGRARAQTDGLRARPVPGRLRREHLPVLGVHAGREHDLAAARLHAGQERGLGQRRAAVVHGGVADVHAGELADGRLELEDGLEHALAALRLVGRVGGEELAAADDGVDHGGHVVVVDAGAEEAHQLRRRHVLAGQAAQLGHDLDLAEAGGQSQRLPPAHVLGDLREQVVDAGGPDGREHLPHVVRRCAGRSSVDASSAGQASSRNVL